MSNLSSLSQVNKDEKGQKINELENNLKNLALGNSMSNEFFHNKSLFQMNENMGFINNNNNNFNNNNINNINNPNLNHSQNNNFRINPFFQNYSFNNGNIKNDYFDQNNNDININDGTNLSNKNHIINQNCYQINIEKLNINNQINNINQNYNINSLGYEKDISKDSITSNDYSKNHKDLYTSNKSSHSMNLNYLINNIEKITENQSGCRLLQNKLQQSPSSASNLYQSMKIKKILKKLSIDSFGNYLIQKLLEYLSNDLIQDFFNNIICPSFIEISLNPHGSRVVQKLLGRIYTDPNLMETFNQCLQKSMLEIFLNQSSTYIIITYIYYIKYPNNQIIYSFIVKNIYYIATHKHSCCTLQKCLEEGNPNQKHEILMSLAYISNDLFADQFGNYAIQNALSLKNEAANQIIISQYLNNFQKNISNRISSNVYEKVLEFCDFQTKQNIIINLCNFETVKCLLYDNYGNYVLQKTILAANEPYRSMYLKYMAPLIDGLKNLPNGYIIIHKIINQFPELQGFGLANSNKNKNYNNYNNSINNNNFKSFNINNKYKGKDRKNTQDNNYKIKNNFPNQKEE